jgi:two-component system cell cycle response regulator DivK
MPARILIVEDNVDLLTILQEVLSADYEVVTAESGEAAIVLARTLEPDLVLLDIHLPGMSGIDAGMQIKQAAAPRFIPILVLTALAQNEAGSELIDSGCCDAVMVKPAPLPTIRAKVDELLYSHTEIT